MKKVFSCLIHFYKKVVVFLSKYQPLWEHLQKVGDSDLQLSFEEIRQIAGVPLDHSFLQYKKELLEYGWQVEKISLKNQTVKFQRRQE